MPDTEAIKHPFQQVPNDLRHAVAEFLYDAFRHDVPGELMELKTSDAPSIITIFLILADAAIGTIEADHLIVERGEVVPER